MDVRIGNVGIDCADLARMTEFWLAVTGYVRLAGDESYTYIGHPTDKLQPSLFIQRVPEPKVGKNRVHIDLYAPDPEALSGELERLGATRLRRHDQEGETWIVFGDPEGNEFCVVRSP